MRLTLPPAGEAAVKPPLPLMLPVTSTEPPAAALNPTVFVLFSVIAPL